MGRRTVWGGVVLAGIVVLVLMDIGRRETGSREGDGFLVDAVSAATRPGMSVVGLIRSDFPRLKEPIAPDAELTYPQVENMVRLAVAMSGGLGMIIEPGTEWIVIKPNIVALKPNGSGVNTDWRVVKAVIKMVYEVAPEARVTIAEGPAEWADPKHEGEVWTPSIRFADGFAVAGYRALLEDPELAEVDLDIVDLNFDEAIEMMVPDGGTLWEKYHVPRTILECDVLVDVPVLKVTAGVAMTVAMKNLVGIGPGMIYGWAKMQGYPPGSGNPGLPHAAPVIDEMIVDLTALADVDFTVVDALTGMEWYKDFGTPVRMNTVLAGPDIVAVDAVCAQVMGMNPDDIEYLTLGAFKGLGQCDLSAIKVNGDKVEEVARKFEKIPGFYGQGNRLWALKGPVDLEKGLPDIWDLKVIPGENGWSRPAYFSHDMIDLDRYYEGPERCAVYAYCEFTVPESGAAQLWAGSDEGMTVWIDGEEVYSYTGSRKHRLPNDVVKVALKEGMSRLLVRVEQTWGKFDFSLNICEDEEDHRYDGNRVAGLKFLISEDAGAEMLKADEDREFGSPVIFSSIEGFDPIEAASSAPAAVTVQGLPLCAENALSHIAALQTLFRQRGEEVDISYLMGISGEAFRLYYSKDTLPIVSLSVFSDDVLKVTCEAMGYSCAYSYSEERAVAWDRLRGWISGGHPAMVPHSERILMESWYVVAGYEEEGEKLYLHSGGAEDGGREEVAFFPQRWQGGWIGPVGGVSVPQFVLGEKIRTPDPVQAALSAFERAIRLAETEEVVVDNLGGGRSVQSGGFSAYELWLQELEEGISHEALTPTQKGYLIAFNGPFLGSLVAQRMAAASYLQTVSGVFDPERGEKVLEAAEAYKQVVSHLMKVQQLVPQAMMFMMQAFAPEEIEKFGNYGQVTDLVREAYEKEKEAIGLLRGVTGI